MPHLKTVAASLLVGLRRFRWANWPSKTWELWVRPFAVVERDEARPFVVAVAVVDERGGRMDRVDSRLRQRLVRRMCLERCSRAARCRQRRPRGKDRDPEAAASFLHWDLAETSAAVDPLGNRRLVLKDVYIVKL